MVATVRPLVTRCGWRQFEPTIKQGVHCWRDATKTVFDSNDRWWGVFCDRHADGMRIYIDDWELVDQLLEPDIDPDLLHIIIAEDQRMEDIHADSRT